MSTPRLGIVINDDNKALRVARHDDPVDLVVLRSTLINPPRAAAATRLREMISGVHPEAEIIPYIWHLVSHGPSDGLREHGSRSLPGEARAFGLLQESEEVRQAWAIVRACAEGLGATKMVLRTPASFTPGATYRERLRRFAEARAAEGLGLVWEAEGLWEPAMTLPLARELDIETLIPAFDGTGRPFKGTLERRWLRVDGAGATTRLRPALAEALAIVVDELEDEEVTILFAGPQSYANLRSFAETLATL
ncbi:MAG: hypothetical protein H6710_06075 [Myxococcales bacterium]|nr:hypothetical protein [Myxococcales bacterium]MCB9704506.1 hypothetical protein [Myxococcales bacterium]